MHKRPTAASHDAVQGCPPFARRLELYGRIAAALSLKIVPQPRKTRSTELVAPQWR